MPTMCCLKGLARGLQAVQIRKCGVARPRPPATRRKSLHGNVKLGGADVNLLLPAKQRGRTNWLCGNRGSCKTKPEKEVAGEEAERRHFGALLRS